MTEIYIEGKRYCLRFDLVAMESIEDAFGSIGAMFAELRGGHRVKALRETFAAMARSGAAHEGRDELITGQEIMRMTVTEMRGLIALIETEIEKSGKTRIREEDDAPDGSILDASEEDDEKNGRAGGR